MKKKVYIAGKVTGLDKDKAERNFQLAERLLLEEGFEVINPLKVVSVKAQGWNTPWNEAMKHCIEALVGCDFLFVLYNWKDSKGACMEVELAKKLKIPVFNDIEKITEHVSTKKKTCT